MVNFDKSNAIKDETFKADEMIVCLENIKLKLTDSTMKVILTNHYISLGFHWYFKFEN